jgi:hypothetical protein
VIPAVVSGTTVFLLLPLPEKCRKNNAATARNRTENRIILRFFIKLGFG